MKKRQRVRSSRERNSKQQAKKFKVKEMLPEKTDLGRRDPKEKRKLKSSDDFSLLTHLLIIERGLHLKCACDAFTVIM